MSEAQKAELIVAEKITTGKAGNTRIIFEAAVILLLSKLNSCIF